MRATTRFPVSYSFPVTRNGAFAPLNPLNPCNPIRAKTARWGCRGCSSPPGRPWFIYAQMLHHFSEMRGAARWSSWQDRTPVAKRDFGKEWVPGSIPGRCSQKKTARDTCNERQTCTL